VTWIDVFSTSLGIESGTCLVVKGGAENSDFIKKIFICVQNINKSLTGLEPHEGE